jgi:hypothetical protein
MLTLTGTVIAVLPGKPSRPDKTTGEVRCDPILQIQHRTSHESNAEYVLEKIKLKTESQVNAFHKCLGKVVNLPVRVWSQTSGDNGLYLEPGVLPTVVQQAA